MAGGCAWSRRVAARMRVLRGLVRDTQRALHDVTDIVQFDPEISTRVQDIGDAASRAAAIVVLGTSGAARARLLHCLLGRALLPDPPPRHCRWLRIQYGSSTSVHLTLGNSEFELVEDLECNKAPWDTLPAQDLIRQDQTDYATMLEIELNIPFLKDGLKIIVPPDIEGDNTNHLKLKQNHSELYAKRDIILRNFNPIYLYAIDRIGKNVFSDNISSDIVCSRSEEDFWTMFNMQQSTNGSETVKNSESEQSEKVVKELKMFDGDDCVFTPENCLDLHQIKEINPQAQVLFVLFADSRPGLTSVPLCSEATESTEDRCRVEDLPESDQELVEGALRRTSESSLSRTLPVDDRRLSEERVAFMNELLDQWELMFTPPPKHLTKSHWLIVDDAELLRTVDVKATEAKDGDRVVTARSALTSGVVKFAGDCLQDYLLQHCTKLSEIHVKLVQQLILASFELARELQVVPKKIQYVAKQEMQLFETIYQKFSEGEKKQELVQMMQEVLLEIKDDVNNMDWSVDDLPWHQDPRRFLISNSTFYSQSVRPSADIPSDSEEAVSFDSYSFDDYDIINSEESLGFSQCFREPSPAPAARIPIANESMSLFSMSFSDRSLCTTGDCMSVKQASLDVQRTVLSKLSRKISLKLVNFVDCLKDTYFGTLQRCLDGLESTCRQELGGRPASSAMRELLSVARLVDLQPCASFSTLRSLLEAARRLFHRLRIVGGEDDGACCVMSPVWRRQAALSTQQSLSGQRLARLISQQILERLTVAHERYQSALTSLESALASRLHHTEDVKLAIRKKYAPSFARLCLESTSMCDLLMYGTPELGREIGRGQYGVVYLARGSWGGHAPAAVKSVLPADERHYKELAMEFFYTRSIPPHPRIVAVHGSVVQRRGGGAPGVLLVSARRARDLHAAVRAGLTYAERMQVAADIVEGIRYLHSLGLVHRDIKMKNVLLDADNRAALSDLGFCAAEALMTGSVVGTPIHMAPELLGGGYDAAVDVYAFGILFWYLCAGNIRLPDAFDAFRDKEQLWTKVKKGLRPERLPHFTDACWAVMQACWAPEPSRRALLGDVRLQLEHILAHARTVGDSDCGNRYSGFASDDDSLDMTGIEH